MECNVFTGSKQKECDKVEKKINDEIIQSVSSINLTHSFFEGTFIESFQYLIKQKCSFIMFTDFNNI